MRLGGESMIVALSGRSPPLAVPRDPGGSRWTLPSQRPLADFRCATGYATPHAVLLTRARSCTAVPRSTSSSRAGPVARPKASRHSCLPQLGWDHTERPNARANKIVQKHTKIVRTRTGPFLITTPVRRRQVAGLRDPVEILLGRYGIAHLYANTDGDLLPAQEFNAARDHL